MIVGDRFIAYRDSVGGKSQFWANTLGFKLTGNYRQGQVVELTKIVVRDEESSPQKMIEFGVKTVDVPRTGLMLLRPVSMVGLDISQEMPKQPEIVSGLTTVIKRNRLFLLLLLFRFDRRDIVKIPVGPGGNQSVYEYVFDGNSIGE